jgi:signal transduction histidine kinase/ligand-binding sensor domain-containing protein
LTIKRSGREICVVNTPNYALINVLARLTAVTFLSAGAAVSRPLSYTADPDYLIATWKTEDGLPEDSATAMVQTHDGYLWFGTFNGLVRYNGSEFTVFDSHNTPGMPGSGIVNLHLDRKGRMWVSTTSGLAVMKDGIWKKLGKENGWQGDFVRTFAERQNGDLLLTSFDGRVAEIRGEKFTPLSPPSAPGQGCFGYADEQGRWWIVQARFTGWWDGERWTPVPSVSSAIAGARAKDGGLWLISGSDLIKLRHGVEVFRRTIAGISGDLWSLSEDSRGNVWLCSTDHGLFQVSAPGKTTHWTSANGLSAGSTRFVFEDREGNVWIGTNNGGLQQFIPRRFQILPVPGAAATVVSSVSVGPSGTIWAATYGQGLFKVEGNNLTPATLPGDPGNSMNLQSVLEDRKGRLWIGSFGGGLTILEGGKSRTIPHEETGGGNVISLFEDSRGDIWLSGGQSVARFRDGAFHPVGDAAGLPNGAVSFFAEDIAGNIWAAHQNGAFRSENGRFRPLVDSEGNLVKEVHTLCQDTAGGMWIGANSGTLMHWRDGILKTVRFAPGFASRRVQGIINDGREWFWIVTGRGILRVHSKDLTEAAQNPSASVQWPALDQFDGLPASGFSALRQPVSALSADGRLWFATPRGVVTTNPANFRVNRVPPQVHIESLSWFRSDSGAGNATHTKLTAPLHESIILPAGSRRLEIQCAALSFKSTDSVRCQMMLEGLDSGWQEMPRQRKVAYYDLAPRDYTFRFRAANADGVWSESDARVAFTLQPYFWDTFWFRGICAVLLIAAGGAVAAWIIKLRHLHLIEQAEIHKQREEIAHLSRVAALNELSGSLAHELNQPLAIILSNAQAAQRLLQRTPVAVDEVHEILTDIVAEDRRAGLVIQRLRAMLKRGESALQPERITAIVEDVLTLVRSDFINRGVTAQTSFADDLPPVMADRIQIQQVLLNLITNACDAMASNEPRLRRLFIATSESDGHARVTVTDEGCGLPSNEPDRVFNAFFTTKDYGLGMGLAICKSIAHAHNGNLTAEPNTPRGTSFHLTLPFASLP